MNTTMKEMQAIEREAEALRRDYQEQVAALGQVREEVTQALVAEEEAQLEARYQVAQEELASTQEATQALVEQVLAGQREHWLQHILTKVVDNYGR